VGKLPEIKTIKINKMTKQMKQNNTIWLFLFIVLFLAGCMSKQEKNEIKFKNLLIECDKQLEFMNDSYNSFGFNPSKAYKVSTEEYDFSIYPSGRMITIKILEFVEDEEYEKLIQILETYYKDNNVVKKIFRNQGGTVNIDCRRGY